MTKEEIVAEIAEINKKIKETTAVLNGLEADKRKVRGRLYSFLEWRPGDVVKATKGIFKLIRVPVDDDGKLRSWGYEGFKQRKNGTFGEVRQYIYAPEAMTLISRKETND